MGGGIFSRLPEQRQQLPCIAEDKKPHRCREQSWFWSTPLACPVTAASRRYTLGLYSVIQGRLVGVEPCSVIPGRDSFVASFLPGWERWEVESFRSQTRHARI